MLICPFSRKPCIISNELKGSRDSQMCIACAIHKLAKTIAKTDKIS